MLAQAQSVSRSLLEQRRIFSNVQDKLVNVGERFPVINGLLNAVRRKKSKVRVKHGAAVYMHMLLGVRVCAQLRAGAPESKAGTGCRRVVRLELKYSTVLCPVLRCVCWCAGYVGAVWRDCDMHSGHAHLHPVKMVTRCTAGIRAETNTDQGFLAAAWKSWPSRNWQRWQH
jgi:hypothetical protein